MKNLITGLSNIEKFATTNYKSIISVSALLTGSLLLSACQSTNSISSNASTAIGTPIAAKTALATALQQQRRQSFSYHSNLELNNDQQFNDINTEQLAVSDSVDSHCDASHDQAYAALLTQAESQKQDILATDYKVQREALKQSYLECAQAYQSWDDNQYSSGAYNDDYSNDYDNDASDYNVEEEVEESVTIEDSIFEKSSLERSREAVTLTETRTKFSNAVSANAVAPHYKQLFEGYDDKATLQDVKKAQLLDAYLLKPLSINAQGVYQPLAGKFTMLASAQYQRRNNHSSINQPIYVDFKTGDLYLWADNFALLTSELLDDKLGTKWQNKWLKLATNDGTLPKDFGRSVIKSHFEALDKMYEQAPISQFDFMAANTLVVLSPKLPQQQLAPMLQSSKIIRRTQSLESYQQSYSDYMRSFYTLISKQYPELIVESQFNDSDNIGLDIQPFTSKILVQQLLAMVKGAIDNNVNIAEMMPADNVNLSAAIQ
jgi:hypothetical protein